MLASVVNRTTGAWDCLWGCSTPCQSRETSDSVPHRPRPSTPVATSDTDQLLSKDSCRNTVKSADESSPAPPYSTIPAQQLPGSTATALSSQIEALIMALNEAIRQQRDLRQDLHHERLERSQERLMALSLLSQFKRQHPKKGGNGEMAPGGSVEDPFDSSESPDETDCLIQQATVLFSPTKSKHQSYKMPGHLEAESLCMGHPETDFPSVYSDDAGNLDTTEIQKRLLRASIQDVSRKIVWYEHETQRLRKVIQHINGE